MTIKLYLSDEQATHLRNLLSKVIEDTKCPTNYTDTYYLKPVKDRIDKELYG